MNLSTHPVVPEEVMAFLDGELSADRSQSVSTHMSECDECRNAGDAFGKTSQSLNLWTTPAVPSQLDDIVSGWVGKPFPISSGSFGTLLRPRGWSARRWVLTLASAGCAFLLLLAISIPNLLRSKMAANESSEIGRQRTAETARNVPVDLASPAASQMGKEKGIREVPVPMNIGPAPAGGPAADATKLLGNEGALDGFEGHGSLGKLQTETEQPTAHHDRPQSEPMIARMVSLSIVVKEFNGGRAALDAVLTRHNGYAANLSVSTPQGEARVIQASLRIPAPQLEATLRELKALGRVEAETQNGEEVTQQHTDLVARIKNDRETELRLQDILRTRTGKVKDVLDVEQEIARVRGEIEQMEAEQKTLEHRVDFATIDLKLAEEYKAQLNTPAPSVLMQLRNAAVNGFRNAFESLLALVLFLAEAGPSLLLWLALLSIPAWRLWKRYRRAQSLEPLHGA